MKKTVFIYTFLILCLKGYNQPTLSTGLDGINFSKGELDVELLTEIITAKQEELQKEFIKKVFLKNPDDMNYTFYEFAYNSFDILFHCKNSKNATRELLENTANLALVYGFAEFYLQISGMLKNTELLKIMNNIDIPFGIRMKDKWENALENGEKTTIKEIIDYHGLCINSLKSKNEKETNFNDFFIDLIYDVLKTNEHIKKLGFFNTGKNLSTQNYASFNVYKSIISKSSNNKNLINDLENLRKKIENEVNLIFEFYPLLIELKNSDLKFSSIKEKLNKNANISSMDHSNIINKFFNIETYLNIPDSILKYEEYKSDLKKIHENITILTQLNYKKQLGIDDFYFIKNNLKETINILNEVYGIKVYNDYYKDLYNITLSNSIDSLDKYINEKTKHFKDKIPSQYLSIIEFLTKINDLDKSSTYSYVLELIKNSGFIFNNYNQTAIFNFLVNNISEYASINNSKNEIVIDIEAIIVELYEKFANRKNNTFEFYFSVGLNQTLEIRRKDNIDPNDLYDYNIIIGNESYKSLTYASEKIGVKMKLMNFDKLRSYDVGEEMINLFNIKWLTFERNKYKSKEPLISNIYVLGFGSGILYNIANTTTGKNFDYPMIGYGIGVSFSNSIDLNIYRASPMIPEYSGFDSFSETRFIGFSMDIQITEYINALRKKRQEKKLAETQSQLSLK